MNNGIPLCIYARFIIGTVPLCIYTYIHAYIHTYLHTHTYIHTYIHTYTHIHTCSYIHACVHTYTHIHVCTYVCFVCSYVVWKEAAEELGTLRAKFVRHSDMKLSQLGYGGSMEDLRQDAPSGLQQITSTVYCKR